MHVTLLLLAFITIDALSVYPPSDQAVVRFLSDTPSQEACENTFHAFLYGLFDVVRQHLTRLATGDDAFNDGMSSP